MKKWLSLLLAVCLLPAGCGKPAEIDKSQTPWVVPSELLGQPIKDALQKDWDWWNGLGKNQLYYSPIDAASGHQSFDSWTDCEEFVGLIVPHLARKLVGNRFRPLLFSSVLLGGTICVLADLLGRILLAPTEIPVGIMMALSGGPFFLFLLFRERGNLK